MEKNDIIIKAIREAEVSDKGSLIVKAKISQNKESTDITFVIPKELKDIVEIIVNNWVEIRRKKHEIENARNKIENLESEINSANVSMSWEENGN